MIDISRHGNPGGRESLAKQGDGREREDDVSQAAGMNNEDLHYSMIIVFALLRFAMLTCAATLSAI